MSEIKPPEKEKSEFESGAIDKHFNPETKVHTDVINAWTCVNFAIMMEHVPFLHEIPTYEEYFKKKEKAYDENTGENVIENFFDKIMAKTDKKRIARYNALVKKFNESLPTIIKEENYEALKEFHKKAYEIITGKLLFIYK